MKNEFFIVSLSRSPKEVNFLLNTKGISKTLEG